MFKNIKKFKKTYIGLFIVLVIAIIGFNFSTLKEGLTNNNTVILMGDSVLNNSNYVSSGKSVVDILKTKTDYDGWLKIVSEKNKLPLDMINTDAELSEIDTILKK